ncbi:hypothetical protein [Blautia massiliensis (ex Durand et al. 2017)]|uniref:hypothetical protein n=1 Tax=Blautia massiliensis (ex Durand et al. 2017) TaxID=1737424 RepID=UPI0039A27CF5
MKMKKVVAMVSALAMVAGLCTSAAADEAATDSDLSEHVEITIGGINMGSSDTKEGWPNEVVQKLEDKFNVTLSLKTYDNESLNLDLSGGNTTDIVQVNDANIEGVVKGKHAVNLEDYKDIAPNIFSDNMNFRNELMKTYKSNGDGVQYFVTPRVTFDGAEANYGTVLNNGYIVRWDLYKEIGCPEINNDDDYIEALKKMKEIYPETEDGLPVYAMSAYNDSQLHAYFYKGCLAEGYINLQGGIYVQNVTTNELVPDLYDEGVEGDTPFWSGVKFYNKLYREGLLDPDCFITKSEDLKEKYNKGQYLGGSVNWYYGTYNENQRTADPETLKEYVTLPSYLGWGNEKNLGGWFGKYFFVSSHSENVERAVMILDYLQSEEFSRDIDSGVEGRWTTDDSGKPSLTADTVAMKTDGSRLDEWKASGIGESDLSAMCGLDYYNVASDGGLIDLWYDEDMLDDSMTYAEKDMCSTLGIDIPSDTLKKRVEAGTSIDLGTGINAIQMGLPTTPKNIVRIDSNCEEITMSAIPSLVQAASDEEFEAAKADLIAQLKDAGAEESVEWWTNAWTEAKTTIEGMTK